jgi:hypothetical protein
MDDIAAARGLVHLAFHNDDDTPSEFVKWLAHAVFGVSDQEAALFSVAEKQRGRAALERRGDHARHPAGDSAAAITSIRRWPIRSMRA